MNRREFLSMATAAIAAASLPLPTITEGLRLVAPTLRRYERLPVQKFDFGHAVGLGVKFEQGGVTKRQAIRILGVQWNDLDVDQREELWTMLERAVDLKLGVVS